ncbi:MAG: hypothetical protein E7773_09925 [Sphingomonas sp.]|uniref:hypothetical protein n=1 Tax=Sphingomonas sp. TaxID=28214 RepID=UPI0011FBC752|nr:hypothetical protein [Sphingomonas sp.]THD36223.1 MAG: hypothetical protein E7773_09925 [Sphingomonas sp.]
MNTIGLMAGVLGSAFFVSSILHALFNAVYTKIEIANVKLLYWHYTILYMFTGTTILFGYRYFDTYARVLQFFVPFWLALHGLRLVLDWSDGVGSRRKDVVIRQFNDALANIVTVVFVLSVAASGDPYLIVIALGLSFGMVGKEFLFRTWTDIVKRRKNNRKTAQQGPGRASPAEFVVLHGFANTFKSAAYMILGFALAYRCLATIYPEYVNLIFAGQAHINEFHRAIAFTAKNFQLTVGDETDQLLFSIVGLEGLCAIVIALSFAAVPYKRN